MFGSVKVLLERRAELKRYAAHLLNGRDVFAQNALNDCGDTGNLVNELQFKLGPKFKLRDGLSGAYIFREIFLRGDYDLPELATAKTIVDIGANVGLFAYYATLNNKSCVIHAFEADPATHDVLSSNMAQVPDRQIVVNNCAVSNEDGTMEFFSSEVSGWSSRYQSLGAANASAVTVPSIKLSSYLTEHDIRKIDVMKIDIEGGEFDVLLGDHDLWNTEIACLVVEVDRNPRPGISSTYETMISELKRRFSIVQEKKAGDYPVLLCRQ